MNNIPNSQQLNLNLIKKMHIMLKFLRFPIHVLSNFFFDLNIQLNFLHMENEISTE